MDRTAGLDVSRLVTFVTVARLGSISAAARALHVTPSAVSQQMTALERSVGVALLQRDSRGVTLTGAGEALREQAEDLVQSIDEATSTMAQLGGKVSGRVRAGTIASAAASLVLPAAHRLRRHAPDVALSVVTQEPTRSLHAVTTAEIDFAVIDVYDHVPVALPSQLRADEVLAEPLVLVTSTSTELPRVPTLAALRDHEWVIPPADAACGAATRYACRAAGFEPRVRWETDDLLLLVASVARGEGVALLPRRAVADSVAPVSVVHLRDERLERKILTVARPSTASRPAVKACLDAVHAAGRQLPSPS